ncbi:Predicted nucleic acid-binding protein, contains PIN domain [Dyadobacter soli]|uniref:Predicted nucleic acid-binding protein, contains PIN domain n=1 Tax=Dyadobacter soli TaxID=659014 RepID=A0A1G7UKN5_9BACT|nr:PIN domain-containing protein [Dyadobacter soli]SDG48076.1 Predicted nucleic acid-binding protein, contains PIN domain [Dyadobacter soli]
MNERVFLDSNILIYSYSSTELKKQNAARMLVAENESFISTQVLNELCNILLKKFGYGQLEAKHAVEENCTNNSLFTIQRETVLQACEIAARYKFSFYDSLIVSAALQCGCGILFTEDMQDGQVIDDQLLIRNPFL